MPSELSSRWVTEDGAALAAEVTARLMSGRPLDGVGLSRHDGRFDLRGLAAPTPARLERYEIQGWFVETLGGLLRFDAVTVQDVDLSGSVIPSLRFQGACLRNCRFDRADCRD